MRSIQLAPTAWAVLDDDDWERLHEYEWFLSKPGYAYRKENGKRIFMHRDVMVEHLEWRKGHWEIHHLDENKLNNTRKNLYVTDRRYHTAHHNSKHTNARGRAMRVCGSLRGEQRQTF